MASAPPVIANPTSYVTQQALALGASGELAAPIGPDRPLPVNDLAYASSVALSVGAADVAPRRGVHIACTAAGNVVLKLSDNSTLTVPVEVGLTILPFAVRAIVTAGTTAAASYASLG